MMSHRRLLLAGLAGAAIAASAMPAFALKAPPPPKGDCCTTEDAPAVKAPPLDTLSKVRLTDHRNQPVTLPDGKVWVVTFFYGHCKDVCPTLLYNMGSVAEALPAAVRQNVRFAAITFDPARDTVAVMAEQAENFELTADYYHLLTGDNASLQALFKAFRFDFKQDRDGNYNHTNLIAVMDGQGRILKHFYGLQPNIERVAQTAAEAGRR